MKNKFLNISKKECLNSYKELIENSDRHLKVAEIIAENQEYGMASSHLILGTEELVKGLIIYLDGEGLNIRSIKGIRKFFYDHSIRHFFSGISFIPSIIIKSFMPLINSFIKNINDPKVGLIIPGLDTAISNKNKKQAENLMKNWGNQNIKNQNDKIELYFDFWKNAETYKQRGFYVDYEDKLLTPKQITDTDYLLAKKITNSFIKDCKNIIAYVKTVEDKEKKVYAKQINDSGFYKNIEDIIKIINGKNSFL